MTRKTVGVCPPTELKRKPRLFRALEEAFPIRFVARQPGELRGGLDAVMLLGDVDWTPPVRLRGFVSYRSPRVHVAERVDLSSSLLLDSRLRERSLVDDRAAALEGIQVNGDTILASCRGKALWTRLGSFDRVALTPEELRPEESLRDQLAPGRWLSLLPLAHFLREVAGDLAWTAPPTRASFVIDDPNLHWPSYGYVRFQELASDAVRNGYHVAFATIPLDAWLVHPRVALLFRKNPTVLSLLVHGNDHVREEFSRPLPEQAALALVAQALRRVARLEERFRVPVSRVMVAPHGLCAEQMMRAMLLSGFEGLCHSWGSPRHTARLLADWEVADLRADGLPVFPRVLVTKPRDDLVLRSFLGQPVILYAHHGNLAEGLDVLANAADFVNREAGVRWRSLSDIARSSFLTRRDGTALRVRVYARRIRLNVPDGVEQIIVELPLSHGEPQRETVSAATAHGSTISSFTDATSSPFIVDGPELVEISLTRVDAVDPSRIASPPRRVQPILRRAATEGRDRLAPMLESLAGNSRRIQQSLRRASG